MGYREWYVRQTEIERAIQRGAGDIRSLEDGESGGVDTTIELPDSERLGVWSKLGIFTWRTLNAAAKRDAKRPYVVDDLIQARSLNLLIGDSGLGKTPLAIQIGLCVAAGIPLFDKNVQQGRVLYCDAETSLASFPEMLQTISRFLGCHEPPAEFIVWSPNWSTHRSRDTAWHTTGTTLIDRVKEVQPSFVVVDSLRTFWPNAERKNEETTETFKAMRNFKDVTWLILHHRRKVNQLAGVADLAENPSAWFQETAGALALINHSDTRCGVIPHPGRGDLLLGGFIRGSGPMTPLDLARATDEEGNPIGYTVLTGAEHLSDVDRRVFDALPLRFRFKDIRERMGGTSDSNAARLLKKCISLQILRKEGTEYVKVDTPVERVECVE